MVSLWTNRDTLERNVPLIRLDNDADLRVWRASIHDSATFYMLCYGATTEKVTHTVIGRDCTALCLQPRITKLPIASE